MAFTGIDLPKQFRIVTRVHMLAWHRDLEDRALAGATIRRKLAALSPLVTFTNPLFAPSVLNGVFPPLEAAHGRAGRADAAG